MTDVQADDRTNENTEAVNSSQETGTTENNAVKSSFEKDSNVITESQSAKS